MVSPHFRQLYDPLPGFSPQVCDIDCYQIPGIIKKQPCGVKVTISRSLVPPLDEREVGPDVPVHRHLRGQEEINRKSLAMFSIVCEEQFSSFPGNKDRFLKYVQES
jgi:hypothetical protein